MMTLLTWHLTLHISTFNSVEKQMNQIDKYLRETKAKTLFLSLHQVFFIFNVLR
jgi:hypothetical protein